MKIARFSSLIFCFYLKFLAISSRALFESHFFSGNLSSDDLNRGGIGLFSGSKSGREAKTYLFIILVLPPREVRTDSLLALLPNFSSFTSLVEVQSLPPL